MLEVSPLEFRFSLETEREALRSFTVKNTGEEPLDVNLSVEPPLELKNSAYGMLAKWISLSETSFELNPKEAKEITFSIVYPETLPAGGQYATIYAETSPSLEKSSSIKLISRAGIKLYGSSSIEPYRNVNFSKPSIPTILIKSHPSANVSVKNSGNIDFSVVSTFSVSSLFGKQLYFDTLSTELYPETSKELFQEWAKSPSIGLYRVSYSTQALDTSIKSETLVLIFSPFFLILFFLTILTIVIAYLARHLTAKPSHLL